jgi:hypothetical protein
LESMNFSCFVALAVLELTDIDHFI